MTTDIDQAIALRDAETTKLNDIALELYAKAVQDNMATLKKEKPLASAGYMKRLKDLAKNKDALGPQKVKAELDAFLKEIGEVIDLANPKSDDDEESDERRPADAVYSAGDLLCIDDYSSGKRKQRMITDFSITPMRYSVPIDSTEMHVVLKFENPWGSKEVIVEPKHQNNKNAFSDNYCDVRFNFMGTANDLLLINQQIIAPAKIPTVRSTEQVGIHKLGDEWLFVGQNSSFNKDGEPIDSIEYVGERDQNLRTQLNLENRLSPADINSIKRVLFDFNTAPVAFNVLGWVAATFLKPALRDVSNEQFPILYMIGEPGAGKTKTIKTLRKVWGLIDGDLDNWSQTTQYTRIIKCASSTFIPILFDEIKKHESRDEWMRMVNMVYNAHKASRGTQDAKKRVNYFNQDAPIVGLGEVTFGDKSTLDRCVVINFSKKDSAPHLDAMDQLADLPLENLGNEMLGVALSMDRETIREMYKNAMSRVVDDSDLKDRPAHNTALILMGMDLLCAVIGVTEASLNYTHVIVSSNDEEQKTNEIARGSNIDKVLDALEQMMSYSLGKNDNKEYTWMHHLAEGRDYQKISTHPGSRTSCYALHMPSCWPLFNAWRDSAAPGLLIKEQSDFMKQIKNHPRFLGYKTARIAGKPQKCVFIEMKEADAFEDEIMDIDETGDVKQTATIMRLKI